MSEYFGDYSADETDVDTTEDQIEKEEEVKETPAPRKRRKRAGRGKSAVTRPQAATVLEVAEIVRQAGGDTHEVLASVYEVDDASDVDEIVLAAFAAGARGGKITRPQAEIVLDRRADFDDVDSETRDAIATIYGAETGGSTDDLVLTTFSGAAKHLEAAKELASIAGAESIRDEVLNTLIKVGKGKDSGIGRIKSVHELACLLTGETTSFPTVGTEIVDIVSDEVDVVGGLVIEALKLVEG